MIPFFLWFISLFKVIYDKMGVDFNQLKAIVGVKLIMDNRRNSSAFAQKGKQKESNYKFVFGILIYSFFGVFVAFAIYFIPSMLVSLTLYFSFLMVTIVMTLISDFSSVLLDTSDNTIILPRPVSGKTLVAARTTHILLYLGQITFGLLIAPLVTVIIKFGLVFSLVFVILTILTVMLSVIFTNGFYLLLMQFTSEEKLKSIINYFQIAMSVIIMGGYQIVPRLMGDRLESMTDFHLSWWSFFIPPMWMAGAAESLWSLHFDLYGAAALVLAIGVPSAGFYLTSRFLAPTFAAKLADLGTAQAETEEREEVTKEGSFSFSGLITKPGLERAAYDLVGKVLSRDRKLKLKIYPSIGTLVIMVFVILMQGKNKLNFSIESWQQSSTYIFLLYSPFFIVQTALAEIIYTDEFKAAWIFTSTPIFKPGLILSGTFKAIFTRFFLPAFGITTVIVLFIWHTMVIDDIFFAFSANLFLFLASSVIGVKQLPLSMDPSARTATGFLRIMMVLILLFFVGGGHFLIMKFAPILVLLGIPAALAGAWFMLRNFQETKWEEIKT